MKKQFTSILTALFVIGQSTAAIVPLANTRINRADHMRETAVSSRQTLPISKVPQADLTYYVDATMSYGGNGYSAEGYPEIYGVNLSVNGDEVQIQGLIPEDSWTPWVSLPYVKGTYDSTAKTITIPTQPFDGEKTDGYTIAGVIDYSGGAAYVALIAGNFSQKPNSDGQYAFYQLDELVFDVNEDLTVLTPRSGFAGYTYVYYEADPENGYNDPSVFGYGFYDHVKSCTVVKPGKEPLLRVIPDKIVFEGTNVVAGASIESSFRLFNLGRNDTDITCECDNDCLVADYRTKMEGMSSVNIPLYFSPAEKGYIQSDMILKASNGSKAKVEVTAYVGEAPDYSSIVSGGDISFANDGDFPFIIKQEKVGEEEITVAASGNYASDGISSLYAYMNVPKGKKGVLSWKGMCTSAYSMGCVISIDGKELVNNVYSHFQGWYEDDISNSIALDEGRHTLTMSYYQFASKRLDTAPYTMKLYLYDLNLSLSDPANNSAILKTESLEFGNNYYSHLPAHNMMTVDILNTGLDTLYVDSAEGNSNFQAGETGEGVGYGEILSIPVTFTADQAGEYDCDMLIKTSAGDFIVKCIASASEIPYDYYSIVTEGNVGFNTDERYPFLVEDGTAFSSTSYGNIINGVCDGRVTDSWLEIILDIPEDNTGTLSWDALTSCADPFSFMEELLYTDYTLITIDGKDVAKFAGAVNSGSSCLPASSLEFGEGRHTVRFNYHKMDCDPAYDDLFKIWNVKANIDKLSVDAISGEGAVKNVMFDLFGNKAPKNPAPGLYIKDGKKIIIK